MSPKPSPSRGVLDTSTVVSLAAIAAGALPDTPLITAVTLAQLSVGPLVARDEQERANRQAVLQQAEAALIRCRSTQVPRAHSLVSLRRCEVPAASPRPAPTTR